MTRTKTSDTPSIVYCHFRCRGSAHRYWSSEDSLRKTVKTFRLEGSARIPPTLIRPRIERGASQNRPDTVPLFGVGADDGNAIAWLHGRSLQRSCRQLDSHVPTPGAGHPPRGKRRPRFHDATTPR